MEASVTLKTERNPGCQPDSLRLLRARGTAHEFWDAFVGNSIAQTENPKSKLAAARSTLPSQL
jgi:hypothetical protein